MAMAPSRSCRPKPDVAFVHAQRADAHGNTHLWGLLGTQKEVAFAAKKVVVVVEEVVDEEVIRRDPNRTLIPGLIVDAVVHEPYGAHPSYVQGYYDRDNDFYLKWDEWSRDQATTEAWLEEWVYALPDRAAYLEKLGRATLDRLAPGGWPTASPPTIRRAPSTWPAPCGPSNVPSACWPGRRSTIWKRLIASTTSARNLRPRAAFWPPTMPWTVYCQSYLAGVWPRA
jgi:hypothetical protein